MMWKQTHVRGAVAYFLNAPHTSRLTSCCTWTCIWRNVPSTILSWPGSPWLPSISKFREKPPPTEIFTKLNMRQKSGWRGSQNCFILLALKNFMIITKYALSKCARLYISCLKLSSKVFECLTYEYIIVTYSWACCRKWQEWMHSWSLAEQFPRFQLMTNSETE